MVFSSSIFLFLFLPVVLSGYYLIRRSYRNFFLLAASLIFYAWGEPAFVFVMTGVILFNYAAAILIDRFHSGDVWRRVWMILGIAGNLGILFVYKYLDFVIGNINRLGMEVPLTGLMLPIGISFFTFQAMSYVIDVYRKEVSAQRNPFYLGLYISFFPQLIAGPIVRYQDVREQIEHRSVSWELFGEGCRRFIIGFSKKVLLANHMALVADGAFALPDGERSVMYAWLGAVAYALHIFFDFAGYSDMAIGLGKMFGFHFSENFNYPYVSASVSEFWRRWHISLGRWFRDYVYISLGGSRVESRARLVFNLLAVWCLTGVWHGASWNFIIWGLLYFVLITFEKLTGCPERFHSRSMSAGYRVFTLLAILGGWILFRAAGISEAAGYGLSMLGLRGNPFFCENYILNIREYGLFFAAALLCSTELFRKISGCVSRTEHKAVRSAVPFLQAAFYTFCFLWSVSYLILGAYNPFVYFNF